MDDRLRALCELRIPTARESAGLHAYDGVVQDLSPDGVRRALGRLGGPSLADEHDEAHLATFERTVRLELGELGLHRRNPLLHIENLQLASYLRPYAPEEERHAALRRHLAGWPDAVEAALESLDRVPAPVAEGLLGAARGLLEDVPGGEEPELAGARRAHGRLMAHLERVATAGDPDPALGGPALARLLGTMEATSVDLSELAHEAEHERGRLRAILVEACAHLRPGLELGEAIASLQADHPTIDGVLDEARSLTAEILAWTRASGLVPEHVGECLVGPAPGSRKWAMAWLAPAGPFEDDGPSWYQVTPPEPDWPAEDQQEWLAVFNRASLPAITVHEVAPGHFTHFRLLRAVQGDVRRALFSGAFVEGWAHYAEEMVCEEGFGGGDPSYAAGMALEGLVRVTRLAVAIGLHSRAMDLEEAARRFSSDAFIHGPAARSEAVRATFDPTYGRYTWGKLAILALREEARRRWGSGYSAARFHGALLDLGAPPLGLMARALRTPPLK